MTRKTAFVIAPGRGSYQADELGYLARYHGDKAKFIASLDRLRNNSGQETITALDQASRFVRSRHTNGENASLLIYACALADFMAIDQDRYEIVAIAGNSMGWYLSLACAGALPDLNGAQLVNHMGTLMHKEGIGGQVLYPLIDDLWQFDPLKEKIVTDTINAGRKKGFDIHVSIRLGGTIVLAGDKEGVSFLMKTLPAIDRFPMELGYHAAFHTPLLDFIVDKARADLAPSLFAQPAIPMIDGTGHIWQPGACDIDALYRYTLGRQINETYDFTKSVEVGLKEFAPDKIIILGPGTSMGPPVAQTLIQHGWYGIKNKTGFKRQQDRDPPVLSMGIDAQRALVTG